MNRINSYYSYEVKAEDDIKQTADLAFEIWHEHWSSLLSSEQIDYMVKEFQSFDAIKKQIENEGYIYKILKHEKENAGYFGICKESGADNYLFLSKIYIKKDFRSKGVGRFAFEEIKDIAKELNLDSIRLCVNRFNASTIKAYEKWGFKIIDTCVRDLGEGFVGDDYVMEFKF